MEAIDSKPRILAFSDIHGEKEKLVKILQLGGLIDEKEDWVAENVVLVGCGDYIDRGPDSKGVIELLQKLKAQAKVAKSSVILLMGNHEKMLFDGAHGNHAWAQTWLLNGGVECLESFGIIPKAYNISYNDLMDIVQANKEFFLELYDYVVIDRTMFIHGGLEPNRKRSHIGQDDVHLWIRENFYKRKNIDFLKENYDVDRVVFGHSVHPNVTGYHDGAILCIDTGAPFSEGRATLVELGEGLEYKIAAQA